MRKIGYYYLFCISIFMTQWIVDFAQAGGVELPQAPAQWTFLVFLNGNNNLDTFGTFNLKQMEQIGSTSDVKVVVQWASLQRKKTVRLLMQKDVSHPAQVTSSVVQDMGTVDMGDVNTLSDFIKWGVQNYPAKHYVIDVWNHGSGWHALKAFGFIPYSRLHITDISWDDNTGHSITTLQLAGALTGAARVIGHKVDLYGSDACLMGSAEIGSEVAASVDTYAGSEEVEAADGWPYDTILSRLVQHPQMSSGELGKVISEEVIKYYDQDEHRSNATFSAFDLSKSTDLLSAMTQLATDLKLVSNGDRAKVVSAVAKAQRFTYDDYADLADVVAQLESSKIPSLRIDSLTQVKQVLSQFVIASGATASLPRALGASIWFPTDLGTLNNYASKYELLKFEQSTHWGDSLKYLLQK